MNSIIIVVRIIITIALLYQVFLEAGFFTALALFILFLTSETQVFINERVVNNFKMMNK